MTVPEVATPKPAVAPTLLVLDTATEFLHLGLTLRGRSYTRALAGGAQASAALLPALRGLLDEAGIGWHELDAIGYGRGPGAFTGVRAACAVTQGLAFGLGKPVLQLDTLMAVAEDASAQGAGDAIQVAVDARMGEAYAAAYRRDAGADAGWQLLGEPALHDPADLARDLAPGFAVAGNSLLAHAEAWAGFGGHRAPAAAPRAEALLKLARWQWSRGDRLDAAQALPLYVRDRVALTTAEREAVQVAKQAAAAATP
ncbi:tRNA (adenosine(37)-N6)-threonylcarbamoyltransferase complex dimerization subunit type 1 TsaB [Rivibacter subsaxonicus]|uniref:tRNA threonylcarbamoyladenosine biosynthesis protein TsaB n=1 Tax=Rivibacter subsaxonicus TaxID=457575 RepID=A0A4Q7VW77_9BURK|nr:tRNA (adenosine(37)-N6)-threonylcarbamoyltransferase complex dimerization subunit type 1 TsaB [Rivibacter subsaxonicus]RZU00569.1 tRNA threonylcarbamoyladenosine biosynthesis protein TsaB [Rivibacter subsaxonicus]